ncbi:hypothetical protein CJ030_MR6G005850 [Morella rubra]|uniref:Uncharacterized protein n=1 Tax=Morella rubra TaxID=262757 RepID=A0A6A1V7T2_9ROSI|nr:hypothetical protein CJ030_MR6G005850 [Morella rubra]
MMALERREHQEALSKWWRVTARVEKDLAHTEASIQMIVPEMSSESNEGLHDEYAVDGMEVDWLKEETCIRCNRGGELLVCREIGCPIALHDTCMSCNPKLDAFGRNPIVRNGQKPKDGGGVERKEPNVSSPCVGNRNSPGHEKSVQVEDDQQDERHNLQFSSDDQRKMVVDNEVHANPSLPPQHSIAEERPNNANISEAHQSPFAKEGEKIQAEDARIMHDCQNEENFEEEAQAEPWNTANLDEEMTVDIVPHASKEGSQDGLQVSEENQGSREDEERLQPEAQISPLIANIHLETNDSDPEKLSARTRRFKQKAQKRAWSKKLGSARKSSSQKTDTPEKNARKPNEKVAATNNRQAIAAKKLRQPRESPKQFTKMTYPNAKRKRLNWTAEEENMLKEGVHTFSTSANKNIPWRKILELGSHIFHVTRTPIDLKDKWKNMMAKESKSIKRRST